MENLVVMTTYLLLSTAQMELSSTYRFLGPGTDNNLWEWPAKQADLFALSACRLSIEMHLSMTKQQTNLALGGLLLLNIFLIGYIVLGKGSASQQ